MEIAACPCTRRSEAATAKTKLAVHVTDGLLVHCPMCPPIQGLVAFMPWPHTTSGVPRIDLCEAADRRPRGRLPPPQLRGRQLAASRRPGKGRCGRTRRSWWTHRGWTRSASPAGLHGSRAGYDLYSPWRKGEEEEGTRTMDRKINGRGGSGPEQRRRTGEVAGGVSG
jgi:hypothetical protein